MKRYAVFALLSAAMLTGCGAYTDQNAAADIAEQQYTDPEFAAESAAETGTKPPPGVPATDDAGRTGYYDTNGIFIPDPSNSIRPADSGEPQTFTEACDVQEQNPAETGPYNTEDWYVLPAEEYFSVFGIRPLPEQLGDYTLEPPAPDARYDIRVRTPFRYTDADGNTALTVYIGAETEFSLQEDQILLHHAADGGAAAEFISGKAQISLQAVNMQLQELERLKTLAQELKSFLVIQ